MRKTLLIATVAIIAIVSGFAWKAHSDRDERRVELKQEIKHLILEREHIQATSKAWQKTVNALSGFYAKAISDGDKRNKISTSTNPDDGLMLPLVEDEVKNIDATTASLNAVSRAMDTMVESCDTFTDQNTMDHIRSDKREYILNMNTSLSSWSMGAQEMRDALKSALNNGNNEDDSNIEHLYEKSEEYYNKANTSLETFGDDMGNAVHPIAIHIRSLNAQLASLH